MMQPGYRQRVGWAGAGRSDQKRSDPWAGGFRGLSNHVAIVLLRIMPHLCPERKLLGTLEGPASRIRIFCSALRRCGQQRPTEN
jgi:hypothetical protein